MRCLVMGFVEFSQTYTDYAAYCFIFGVCFVFALRGLDAFCDWVDYQFRCVRCKGFMTGQIRGKCHVGSCYYCSECVHYAPPPPVLTELKRIFGLQKNKR